MTKKQKKNLKKIIISLVAFLIAFITNIILKSFFDYEQGLASIINNKFGWLVPFTLYLIIYLYIGKNVIIKAIKNIKNGHIFDENFLMLIATIGAFSLGIYRSLKGLDIEGFDEACAVIIFYQVGEWFQSYAVSKSRKSISDLMDIRPDFANLYLDGKIEVVDPSMVKVDDIIIVKPGEKIPLDGIIIKGQSTLDTKALTGESLPQEVSEGMNVISGVINITSVIEIKVLKTFYDSTVSKILDLVSNASNNKSKSENFITKFSRYYTPIVVILALLLAIIPSIITHDLETWIYRALSFLVVSCPCALVISIPLTFFAGIGGASANGILIKGSNYIEKFNDANIFVFDKTGTLTKGNFKVVDISPASKKNEILRLASIAENNSNHPIALSIKNEYKLEIDNSYELIDVQGKGIIAKKEDIILCGNHKLMDDYNISYDVSNISGTKIYVALNNIFVGSITISDEIKDDSVETINYLNSINAKTIMLTGDNDFIAKDVANKLNLTDYKASLLPQDKVYEVDNLLNNKLDKDVLCFIGDGINDAPVLMKSDIGISMGDIGSDAAIEASDIVLMHGNLNSIIKLKKLCKRIMRIAYENIYFALGVKILILIFSAIGLFNNMAMWFAVFGDVGVAFIAILNASRANYKFK